jgi:hypothetical protein
MRTFFVTLAIALLVPAIAPAHFLFVLPPAANSQQMPIVWSDGPVADPKISTESLIQGVAKKLDGTWTELSLEPSKVEGVWRTVNAADAKVITAKAEYGLVNRGEGHVFLVRYLAKWSKAVEATPAEATMTVELTAVRGTGGFHFVATQGTKPLALTDVTVYEPNSGKTRTVKTDAQGKTPTFSTAGQYAARVFWNDATGGEYEGRKYRGTYYYSTLTTEYRP